MKNIDYYIEQVRKNDIDGGIEETKAYRFKDDGVVLVAKPEPKFYELKQKIDLCKKKGINIPEYYDYKETDSGECYILEEIAKGTEFAHLVNNNLDAFKVVSEIPYAHIEKYIKDAFLFELNGIGVEPRRRNIFYDKDVGFTVIDVGSMEPINIENMTIKDVDYFFEMYKDVIPHRFEANDNEKNVSNRIKADLIRAFEKGHPLFKKYERWIFRRDKYVAKEFDLDIEDLNLNKDELEYLKKYIDGYIESVVEKNSENLHLNYRASEGNLNQDVIMGSVGFCSQKDLFGSNDISLEAYVTSSVYQRLESKQRKEFPKVFENRDKCISLLSNYMDSISEETLGEKTLADVRDFVDDLETKLQDNQKISVEDAFNMFYNIALSVKKIYIRRTELSNDYFFTNVLNRLLDLIPASELIDKIRESNVDSMVERMAQGVDVLGENSDVFNQSNGKTKGYAKVWILGIITTIVAIGIIILGMMLK